MTFINGGRQLCSYLYEISFISGNQFTSSRASFAVRQEIEKGLRAVDSNAQQPSAVNIIISAIITTIVVVNIINILIKPIHRQNHPSVNIIIRPHFLHPQFESNSADQHEIKSRNLIKPHTGQLISKSCGATLRLRDFLKVIPHVVF